MTWLALILAALLDKALGDPGAGHPIVYFGKAISKGEKALNRGRYRKLTGSLLAGGMVAGVFLLVSLILIVSSWISPWLALAVNAVGAFYMLAYTTLVREARMVFEVLDEQGITAGRQQVARIVGRDTSQLTAQQVRQATLETLAENLSDGVIAPIFWFVVLGLPGMTAYKMINTLDSMIGYKTERYWQFGWAAAKIDDLANWLPARITAALIAANSRRAWAFIWRYGNQHASPNAGYPEAALAGRLNCQFGGPNDYFGQRVVKPYIGEVERVLTAEDMQKAVRITATAYGITLALAIVLAVVFASA
ncbi:adenosylcobinamide-phosphate synthase CbiB [Salinibius halmophilus]|uniref:adenosylcobinamide-phosphate synthase CbiB n=1 Tax=Salinibius halmophilus TaxID=1853216 RepID=UPI000E6612E2|nr:adenosylcobinamide-phosphate synthase CbiB [Salinibius halmophilus]